MNHPLLLEIQLFAAGKNGFSRDEPPEGRKRTRNIGEFFQFTNYIAATLILVKKSLKLLEELPVIRDTVFDYYSNIFDVSIGNYINLEVLWTFLPKIFNTIPQIPEKLTDTAAKRQGHHGD